MDRTQESQPGQRRLARWAALGWILVAAWVTGCGSAESGLVRGDQMWADSNYVGALAEYRLSLRHRGEQDEVLARVAHAYVMTGQLDRAREHYDRLIARNPEYTDQAVFDYVRMAQRSQERSDRHGLAGAVEAALLLRPGLPLQQMAAPLARYYAATGDAERAMDYYEQALTFARGDSVPALLFELGEVQVARGLCEEAMGTFDAFRARAGRGDRIDQARWHTGNCAFELGRSKRAAGNIRQAVTHFETVIQLETPRNLLDQAWFERGEALLELGRRDEALESFLRVIELNQNRPGQLVQRARQRVDEIRFGGWGGPPSAPEPGSPDRTGAGPGSH
jgi:tetratricopeptide (TPR) repeat protein